MSPRISEATIYPAPAPVIITTPTHVTQMSGDLAPANDNHSDGQRSLLVRRRKRWSRRASH